MPKWVKNLKRRAARLYILQYSEIYFEFIKTDLDKGMDFWNLVTVNQIGAGAYSSKNNATACWEVQSSKNWLPYATS